MEYFFALLYKLLICYIIGCSLAYLVFIWFRTTFLIEYAKLVGLQGVMKEEEWENFALTHKDALYPVFLRESYPCWFTKLVGCPFCIIGFMSLFVSLPVSWWAAGPIAFFCRSIVFTSFGLV